MQIFKKISKKLNTQLNKNLFSGSVVHALNLLIALVSFPIFIKFLGIELFGVWTLLAVIISFAQVGDFGISKAIIFYSSEEKKNKETK